MFAFSLSTSQLQRDDADERKRDQRDPRPAANQPVQGGVAPEAVQPGK